MSKFKLYDPVKLKENLEKLTGRDFTKAETEARMEGDKSIDIMLSRTFYAAVAAKALGVPLPDIQDLPIKEYSMITGDVGNFLLGQLEAER